VAYRNIVIESGVPLPRGKPASLWFFAATLVVFLLQVFPVPGIFMMFLGAAFWSVVLINLGMGGIIVEVVMGKVRPVWLLLPLLYFGLYGLFFAYDRWQIARVRAEVAAFNDSQPLPFNLARQDLLIHDELVESVLVRELIRDYAIDRVFHTHEQWARAGHSGKVVMIGASAVCNAVVGNSYFRSADINIQNIYDYDDPNYSRKLNSCLVSYPATPDRPVIEVQKSGGEERRGWLPVKLREITLTDSVTQRTVRRRWGSVAPLKFFPQPILGCGTDSDTPKWECVFVFNRSNAPLVPAVGLFNPSPLIASALGIKKDDQPSSRAVSAERFFALAAAVEQSGEAKELALIEKMIAQPTEDFGYIRLPILHSKPDKIAPLVPQLVEALGVLQSSNERLNYDNGEAFWALLAAAPDDALAPYRSKLISWLMPDVQKEWTKRADMIFKRLDASDAVEGGILLDRLEGAEEPRDVEVDLLYGFCRMGVDAPPEVKERMLALWRKHGSEYEYSLSELYFTLARMGLKDRVGKPKSPGTEHSVIWERVGPEVPSELCPLKEKMQSYVWDSEEQRYLWKKG
jgi:hypothetical protein